MRQASATTPRPSRAHPSAGALPPGRTGTPHRGPGCQPRRESLDGRPYAKAASHGRAPARAAIARWPTSVTVPPISIIATLTARTPAPRALVPLAAPGRHPEIGGGWDRRDGDADTDGRAGPGLDGEHPGDAGGERHPDRRGVDRREPRERGLAHHEIVAAGPKTSSPAVSSAPTAHDDAQPHDERDERPAARAWRPATSATQAAVMGSRSGLTAIAPTIRISLTSMTPNAATMPAAIMNTR